VQGVSFQGVKNACCKDRRLRKENKEDWNLARGKNQRTLSEAILKRGDVAFYSKRIPAFSKRWTKVKKGGGMF